jgi:diguanylate cyclase (GGDEF)-like protein/PAS domain S-box-containing protein
MVKGFLKIILPLVLISALAIAVFQVQTYRFEVEDLRASGQTSVLSGREVVYDDFIEATADLRTLAASSSMQRMLESDGTKAKSDVAKDFLAFAANKHKYDQIRYIDSQGMEAIRVNYNDGQPEVVARDQLQNKADRYYFQDTILLKRDEIFVSPLDLNIEKGQIEQPLKPMIRFGLPLYDSQGSKQGILIVNYLGNYFLDHLRTMAGSQETEVMLLNAEGYWLLAPDPADEWGFMFKNERRFPNRYPAPWEDFNLRAEGVYQDEMGIFAYAAIRPVLSGQFSSSGAVEAYSHSTEVLDARDYVWTLLSYTPKALLEAKQARRWRIGLLQYAFLLLVLIPLTLALSWAHVRRRAADTLVEKLEQHMRDITQSLAVGLFVLDRTGRLRMMNLEAERLLGWSEEELVGKRVEELFLPDAELIASDYVSGESHNGFLHEERYRSDKRFQRKEGSSFHAAFVVSPLMIGDEPAGSVISFQDVSDKKEMERELERMATQDELTGLYNRRELNRRLAEEIRRAERYEYSFSIWMLDVDYFKRINDVYGHQQGDRVLKILATSLKQMLRETDVAARFGGEEFTVILSHTSLEQAKQMAQRVRQAMADMEIHLEGGGSFSITASIGVAAYPQHGTTVEELIRAADQALYTAKQKGRNRVCVNLRAVS